MRLKNYFGPLQLCVSRNKLDGGFLSGNRTNE